MLDSGRLRDAGQVDPAQARRLFVRQANRPDDTTALTIWALLVHEVWREQLGAAARSGVTEVAA